MAKPSKRKSKNAQKSDETSHFRQMQEIIEGCRIPPGAKVRLSQWDPAWAGNPNIPKKERKKLAEQVLSEDVSDLAEAQELLYAADSWSVLVVLQAMDAAGKDGTIRHVMSGVNPQGCQVFSFKQPSTEELDHNFLWRCSKALPERGRIGIFNRSYYEEVLVVRVHPNLLTAQRLPDVAPSDSLWQNRYEDINNFEKHLTRNGTAIVKIFLHVSKEEQRQRFLERIANPEKHWKFSDGDVKEREYWDQYMQAYEDMLSATSTEWAPWHVVPADHKWVSRAITANLLSTTIGGLSLEYPVTTPERARQIKAAKKRLLAEK